MQGAEPRLLVHVEYGGEVDAWRQAPALGDLAVGDRAATFCGHVRRQRPAFAGSRPRGLITLLTLV